MLKQKKEPPEGGSFFQKLLLSHEADFELHTDNVAVLHVIRKCASLVAVTVRAEIVRPESREAELVCNPIREFRGYNLIAGLTRFRIAPPLPCGSERKLVENNEFHAAADTVDEIIFGLRTAVP